MSDDIIITEQTEVDEAAAFGGESTNILEDDGLNLTEKKEDDSPDDKKPDKKDDKAAAKEESDDKTDEESEEETEEKDEESEEDETEEDDDVKRGKEILDKETKAQAEKEAAERAVKEQRVPNPSPPSERKLDGKTIEWYKSVIPPNFLPENVTLADGSVLDFASMPEVPVAAAAIAHNIVSQMIHNGYLMTATNFENLSNSVNQRLFMNSLTNTYDGVPKAAEIAASDGFKKWFTEQSKEIQALQRSGDYRDHAKLFKRYLNASGIEKAKEKVNEIDDKRKEKKKQFDDIHKTTVKSKGKPKASSVTPREEELEGFTSKDNDDDFYLR